MSVFWELGGSAKEREVQVELVCLRPLNLNTAELLTMTGNGKNESGATKATWSEGVITGAGLVGLAGVLAGMV